MLNKTINGFSLIQEIGKGGMATIYLGINTMRNTAAFKVLEAHFAKSPEILQRFEQEAHIMQALDHPNIRKVYDYVTVDGFPVIQMEYLDGMSMAEHIAKNGKVSPDLAEVWLTEIWDAFEYMRLGKEKITHRDIKPANIFILNQVANRVHIKLIDFGIARKDDGLGLTNGPIGTPNYMSPEQIENPEKVIPATDVYSLGISMVHALSGKMPYNEKTSRHYIEKAITTGELPELNSFPDAWQNVIKAHCQKEPLKRPKYKSEALSYLLHDEGTIHSNENELERNSEKSLRNFDEVSKRIEPQIEHFKIAHFRSQILESNFSILALFLFAILSPLFIFPKAEYVEILGFLVFLVSSHTLILTNTRKCTKLPANNIYIKDTKAFSSGVNNFIVISTILYLIAIFLGIYRRNLHFHTQEMEILRITSYLISPTAFFISLIIFLWKIKGNENKSSKFILGLFYSVGFPILIFLWLLTFFPIILYVLF